MKLHLVNRIASYPIQISWAFGALVINTTAALWIYWETAHFPLSLWALAAIVPLTILGFFLGMITVWPKVRDWCAEKNSPSLIIGDQVLILRGSDRGTVSRVYDITQDQGGWNIARLDLGEDRKSSFKDIFEYYEIVKLIDSEQDHSANSLHASRSTLG